MEGMLYKWTNYISGEFLLYLGRVFDLIAC